MCNHSHNHTLYHWRPTVFVFNLTNIFISIETVVTKFYKNTCELLNIRVRFLIIASELQVILYFLVHFGIVFLYAYTLNSSSVSRTFTNLYRTDQKAS